MLHPMLIYGKNNVLQRNFMRSSSVHKYTYTMENFSFLKMAFLLVLKMDSQA